MNLTTFAPETVAIRYSIVVPFYNEEANVAALLAEIEAVMAPLGHYEIVAVDDGSSDHTLGRLRSSPVAHLHVLAHARNRGQSAALCSGIDAARGTWVITLDGDGQNDPADIPGLLRRLDEGSGTVAPVLVCGHRQLRRDNVLRRLSSRVANNVRAGLLRDATPDTGCGLKLIRREAFLRLPRFDHMHRFLPALIRRDGGAVLSVVVSHRPRRHGQSKYGVCNRLWVGIVDLAGVMWLKRRAFRPSSSEDSTHGH